MNQAESSEKIPKRMVRKSVVVALGIICIVLVASLAGTFIVANSQNTTLQMQLDDLSDVVDLKKSFSFNTTINVWSNAGYLSLPGVVANSSGYLRIDVEPDISNLWVEVDWQVVSEGLHMVYYVQRFQGPMYDWHQYYPVIASPSDTTYVLISIANNSTETITANVTITYYY